MRTGQRSLKRRKILETGLAGTVGCSLLACGRTGSGRPWRFFTAAEARTMDANCPISVVNSNRQVFTGR